MRKKLLTLIVVALLLPVVGLAQTMAPGNVYPGNRFPNIATQQDSLLVVLVGTADSPFRHNRDSIELLFTQTGFDSIGSFRDYFLSQSGGLFDPGIRVVGPVNVSDNLNDWTTGALFSAIDTLNAMLDLSHFDNDGDGNIDGIIVLYCGDTIYDYTYTYGSWDSYAGYAVADSNDSIVIGLGDICMAVDCSPSNRMPIGLLCSLFGQALGLPDMSIHGDGMGGNSPGWLDPMDVGYLCGDGRMPANMTTLERYWLGWSTLDTLSSPADSISLTVGGMGMYLPIDGDEFYLLEARSPLSHWDSLCPVDYMGEGGLIVWKGKQSKFGPHYQYGWHFQEQSIVYDTVFDGIVVNDTTDDRGWYSIWGGIVGDGGIAFGANGTQNHFTPASEVRPMKNDSTLIGNIWITNIHWTSDTTMAFSFDTVSPEKTVVDILRKTSNENLESLVVTNTTFSHKGYIVSTAGPLTAKGIVYNTTEEGCTMEQGMLTYDTALSDMVNIVATANGLTPGTTYYYRFFATAGGQTAVSPVQQVTTKLAALRNVYYYKYGDDEWEYRHVFDIELAPQVEVAYVYQYTGQPLQPWILNDSTYYNGYNKIDTSGPVAIEFYDFYYVFDSIDSLWAGAVGLWCFTADGDTVSYVQHFDKSKVDTIMGIDLSNFALPWRPTADGTAIRFSREFRDDNYGYVFDTLDDAVVAAYHVGIVPRVDYSDRLRYYAGDEVDSNILYRPRVRNYSLLQRLIDDYGLTEYSALDSIVISLHTGSPDSLLVIMVRDTHDIVQPLCFSLPEAMPVGAGGTAEIEYVDCNSDYIWMEQENTLADEDTLLTIHTDGNTAYFYTLLGSEEELAMLGVTDIVSATAYCMTHQSDMVRHDCRKVSMVHYDNYYHPDTIEHSAPNTVAVEPGEEFLLYFFPFNANGIIGEVTWFENKLPELPPTIDCTVAVVNLRTRGHADLGTNGYEVEVSESTAYYHVVFGEESELAALGINNIADAKQYSATHGPELTVYTARNLVCDLPGTIADTTTYESSYYQHMYCNRVLSIDSFYYVYAIPYSSQGVQGVARQIRFTNSSVVVTMQVYTDTATEVDQHNATLHGHVGAIYSSQPVLGFFWKKTTSNQWDTVFVDQEEDYSTFSYTLTGLETGAEYMYYSFIGIVYDNTFYGASALGEVRTFRANCRSYGALDTSVCHNTPFNGQVYNEDQQLQILLTAVNGCDSIVAVNLHVRPEYNTIDSVVLCYGEVYDGQARYSDDVIWGTTTTSDGMCDSSYLVQIRVIPRIYVTIRDTIHDGSYWWNGIELTDADTGHYLTMTFTSVVTGCDSIVSLYLVGEQPDQPVDGIIDVNYGEVKVFVQGRNIVVEAAEGYTVAVYDAIGRPLAVRRDGITFEAPAAGVYFIKIGENVMRRVVVVR